jgi:hypothetical protein
MSFDFPELIIVTSGKRWNKFKEWGLFHPVRGIGEGLIPEYKEKMEILRDVDDKLNLWVEGLENAIKDMRKAFQSKSFKDLFIVSYHINKNLENINRSVKRVNTLSEKALEEFSLPKENGLTEEDIAKYNSDYSEVDDLLRSTAGVLDFLERKKREWVANKLKTQKYNAIIIKIKSFLEESEKIIKQLKSTLEEAGEYRRSGDIGKYLDKMNDKVTGVAKLQDRFLKIYTNTYYEALDPLFKRHGIRMESEENTSSTTAEDDIIVTHGDLIELPSEKEEVKPAPTAEVAKEQKSAPQEFNFNDFQAQKLELDIPKETFEVQKPQAKLELEVPKFLQDPQSFEEEDTYVDNVPSEVQEVIQQEATPAATEVQPIKKQRVKKKKVTAEVFYNQLKKVASFENNALTKSFILKYAETLDKDDINYLKLIAIAEGL